MYLQFFLCVPSLSVFAALSMISHFRQFTPLLLYVKVTPVLLFFNVVVRLLPRNHRSYILSLILQGTLSVDERYITLMTLKE